VPALFRWAVAHTVPFRQPSNSAREALLLPSFLPVCVGVRGHPAPWNGGSHSTTIKERAW